MNTNRTVVEVFEQACQRYGDKPAFTCLGHTISFKQLDELSGAFAAYLQNCTELQPGDRVAIQMPNLLQYPVALFGILRAGMVIVNTNPLYTPREMELQFKDSDTQALIVLANMAEKAAFVASQTGIETVIVTDALDLLPVAQSQEMTLYPEIKNQVAFKDALDQGRAAALIPPVLNPDQLTMLQYTGGTTGVAKGVMLNNRNLVANMLQAADFLSDHLVEGEEIYVAPLPLYHIYAFTFHCMMILSYGGHNVLIPDPRDIPSLVNAMKPFKITGFAGLNTLFNALCHDNNFKQLDFSQLKLTASGGMALTTDVAELWQSVTGCEISEGFGMTEASPMITANPPGKAQIGTVGLPVLETETKLIDLEGNTLLVGEIGELCIRGPQVMQGYWNKPELTAEVLSEEGWLRTGDVAQVQEDGYIRIVDRMKDMIVVSGFNVYPNEIEEVASGHPAVLECSAVGIPDEKTGEAVKLYVVPKIEDFNIEDLRNYLKELLTPYKVPKYVEIMEELPKSNVGKILRRNLRE